MVCGAAGGHVTPSKIAVILVAILDFTNNEKMVKGGGNFDA